MSPRQNMMRAAALLALAAPVVAQDKGSAEPGISGDSIEDSYFQRRRAEEKFRQELRDKLGWEDLGEEMKRALWDIAVGPDNINREGNLLVEIVWASATTNFVPRDMDLNVEGDVMLTGGTETTGGSPKIRKLDAALNQNVGGEVTLWTDTWSSQNGAFSAAALDLDGNAYTAVFANNTSQSPVIAKYSTDGQRRWETALQPEDRLRDIEVDGEGVLYVCGESVGSQTHPFVMRLDMLTGGVYWRYDYPEHGDAVDLVIDRRGGVFVLSQEVVDQPVPLPDQDRFGVSRFDPWTGERLWHDRDTSFNEDTAIAMEIDFDGCPIIVVHRRILGLPSTLVRKLSPDGEVQWSNSSQRGIPTDIVIAQNGAIYTCGESNPIAGSDRPVVVKYTSNGSVAWTRSLFSETDIPWDAIALDRLGNPYVVADFDGVLTVNKYDKADADGNGIHGELVWTCSEDLATDFEDGVEIVVDAGGNVFVEATFVNGNAETIKYSQLYESVPQVITDNPTYQIEGESIWHPSIPSINYYAPLFSESWNIDPNLREDFHIDLVGDFGGGLTLDTDGDFELGFEAVATLGTMDVVYPGEVTVVVPGFEELFAGMPATITVDWDPDEGGASLTSNATPQFDAGLTAEASNVDVEIGADLEAFSSSIFDETFVNVRNLDTGRRDVPGLSLNSFLDPPPPPGAWVNFGTEEPLDGWVVGQLRYPALMPESEISNDGLMLSSAIDEKFLNLRANITQILSTTLFGFPTFICEGVNTSAVQLNLTVSAIQAFIEGDFFGTQMLDVTFEPYATLDFSDGIPDQTIPLLDENGDPNSIEITFPNDGNLTIDPTYGVTATIRNRTGFRITGDVGWETFRVSAIAGADLEVDEVNIFDFDECFQCDSDEIANFDVTPYDQSWTIQFPEQSLARINVLGSTDTQPRLYGASREFVRMHIYDQTSPSIGEFNLAVNDTSRLVLYGDRFFAAGLEVRLSHHGRVVFPDFTRINNNAILVELPNRLFLVPGVARIWISNNAGRSETIDLPVEYPRPVLETVNPNLWAADPALAEVPIAVIDGGTAAGADSFIARRDYWIVLRDQLWNATTADGMPAEEYFPDFDFDAPPVFPTVRFDGMALARFEQPIDNGIHNVRLPTSLYDRPGLVPVQLCNPGPGGGPSGIVTLDIAAPRPVIGSIEPSIVPPGGGEFRMIIHGPPNVPYFQGYEEPKFGNFTAASQAYVTDPISQGETMLTTEFVSSSQLVAIIPASIANSSGTYQVGVRTPHNDSVYFEELWVHGETEPTFQGLVASGGDSDPVLFHVKWEEPVITAMSAYQAQVGSPVFDVSMYDPQPTHNLSITGENFAPGCVVWFGGVTRPTTRVSENTLEVLINPRQISIPGTFEVVVENPSPNRATSAPMEFEVVPAP